MHSPMGAVWVTHESTADFVNSALAELLTAEWSRHFK